MAKPLTVADGRLRSTAAAYVPELDGLRAVSIVLVVLSHFGLKMVPGLFGVTVFFFVSGYLITGHLLAEVDRRGTIGLAGFYLRRALRLYPALIVAVAAGGGAVVALGGVVTLADVASALFYAVNLREYVRLLDEPLPGVPHPFGVLWSLAVEEHYYLLFPLLTVLLARRRAAFLAAMVAIVVLVTGWRVHMAGVCAGGGCTFLRIEHGTDTRLESIVYGALLATVLAGAGRGTLLRLVQSKALAAGSLTLLLAAIVIRDAWFRDTFRFTFQGVGLFFGLAAVLFAGWAAPVRALLGHPVLIRLGRWSYSLYLWHWIVLVLFLALAPVPLRRPLEVFAVPPPWWLATVLPGLLTASVATAALSYYGVERPLIRLRRALGSNAVG